MALTNIPKFERRNNVSISVYGYQEGKEGFVYPLKVSKEQSERHVNLLLMSNVIPVIIAISKTLTNSWGLSIPVVITKHTFVGFASMGFQDTPLRPTCRNIGELMNK